MLPRPSSSAASSGPAPGPLGRESIRGGCPDDHVDALAGEGSSHRNALLPIENAEGTLDDASEVQREAIGGFGLVEVGAPDFEVVPEPGKLCVERFRNQDLVETALAPHRAMLRGLARVEDLAC